jgi:maleate cis-trans isomerase
MAYTSWRGLVGMIKPTMRPGSLENNIRLLPEGIGIIPLYLGVYGGSETGFRKATGEYERLIEQLVEQRVDVISAGGEPPFMMQGVKGEAATVRKWEAKYKVPILSTGRNAVAGLRAMKVKNMILIRATAWDRKGWIAKYFKEAGFNFLGAHAIDATWEGIV